MSDAQAQVLEAHLKKTTIVSNVFAVIAAIMTAISVAFGFYYKTDITLRNHSGTIIEIQKDIKKTSENVQNLNLGKGISKVQIESMTTQIQSIEKSLNRLDEKMDQIIMQTR